MQNWRRRDFIVIRAFHYVHVVMSIPWTVIGCWPRNGYICVYIYRLVSIMSRGLYWFTACFIFVCKLDASWNHWAAKCCYYCCLFCSLEKWLLHFSSPTLPVGWVVWGLCQLYGNNLDRAQGIFNNQRHGDVYVACCGGGVNCCACVIIKKC